MTPIANSSILIALSSIGELGLLYRRFPAGIRIPQRVWEEVVEEGEGQVGSEEVASAQWIDVCEVKGMDRVALLAMELDEGEAEAIALCCELQAGLVLLDEKDARRTARHLGLRVLGTVGVLIWAKSKGLVSSLREQLDALQERGAFRLGRDVYTKAPETVGEA